MKNDQLNVDGARVDGDLIVEVPYKSMGSKCGSSSNSQLEFWEGHLACHTLLSVQRSVRWLVHSSSAQLLFKLHFLPILLHRTSAFKLPSSFALYMLN